MTPDYDRLESGSDETPDDLETLRLRKIDQWKRKKQTTRPLSDWIDKLTQQLPKTHKRTQDVQQVWHELLPESLTQHSCLHQIRGGRLTVAVDSAAHLQELSMLVRGGLVEQLRQICPNTGLREIRLIRGPVKPVR